MADYDKDPIEDESDRGEMTPAQKANSDSVKPKPRIVSKAELEKSGLSLRDFLNKERGLTRRGSSASYDPTAGEAKDKAAQAAADEMGDRPAKPKAVPMAESPKKEMYRTMSGKMAEKTSDRNPAAGLGDLISRGAKAAGEAMSNYKFVTPAERKSEENRKAKEARGYKAGGSVSKASSRGDGIAQRGKTRGKLC
jgi:hypothetical protein